MTAPTEVSIAGVPWPAYKLVALAVGALVLVVVALAAASPAAAVLAAAAATVVVWSCLSTFSTTDVPGQHT
jgi:hypothetical protein